MKEWFYLTTLLAAILVASFLMLSSAEAKPTAETVALVKQLSTRYQIDPVLVLAVMKVESDFNDNAVGTSGERSVMQLHPRYHTIYRDPAVNIETAVAYLARLKTVCGPKYGSAWFICYNYGPKRVVKHPKLLPYFRKIIKAKREVLPYVAN